MSEQNAVAEWYSYKGGQNPDENVHFYDVDNLDWVREVENNFETIRDEIMNLLEKEDLEPYFNSSMVSKPKVWKTLAFYFWSVQLPNKYAQQCPKTMAVLSRVPGWISASVNLLEADSDIFAHVGDTNAIYRCHLGLLVPGSVPECGFEVGGEQRSWQQGKVLVFNDSAKHRAWNHTRSNRLILNFDVIRPEFLGRKHRVCANVLASIVMQIIAGKLRLEHLLVEGKSKLKRGMKLAHHFIISKIVLVILHMKFALRLFGLNRI